MVIAGVIAATPTGFFFNLFWHLANWEFGIFKAITVAWYNLIPWF
jgi:hypothetical protein